MWCPSSKQKCPLSVCELPVEHHFGGPHAEFRGNLYMLEIVGSVLEKANGCVAGLVFDAHGTHSYLKRLLHGQLEGLPQEATQAPWFKTLTFKQLPENDLPRLPISVAHFQDQPVWAIPGICNLLDKKSFVEQLGFVDNGIVAFLNLFFSWFWHVDKNRFCRANVFYLMELLIECCCFLSTKNMVPPQCSLFHFEAMQIRTRERKFYPTSAQFSTETSGWTWQVVAPMACHQQSWQERAQCRIRRKPCFQIHGFWSARSNLVCMISIFES